MKSFLVLLFLNPLNLTEIIGTLTRMAHTVDC